MPASPAPQVQIPFIRRYNLRPRSSATSPPALGPSWTLDGDSILVTVPSSNCQGTHMRWIPKGADGPYRVALDGDDIVVFGKDATYFEATMKWIPRQSEIVRKEARHVDILRTPSPSPVAIPATAATDADATPRARTVMRDVFITPPDHRTNNVRPPNAPRRRSTGAHPLIRQRAILEDEMEVEGILGADARSIRAGLGNGLGHTQGDSREMMRHAEFDEDEGQTIKRLHEKRLREIRDEEMECMFDSAAILVSNDGKPRSYWDITAELPDVLDEDVFKREGSIISSSSRASTEIVMDDNDNGSNFFDALSSFSTTSTAEVRNILFSNLSNTTSMSSSSKQDSISSYASTEIVSDDGDDVQLRSVYDDITNRQFGKDKATTETAIRWPNNRVVRFASPLELSQGNRYATQQPANTNNSRRVSAPQPQSTTEAVAGPGPSTISNTDRRRRRSIPEQSQAQTEALQLPFYIGEEGAGKRRQVNKTFLREILAEFMDL